MTGDPPNWKPKRTLAECRAMMCGPGAPFEMHHTVIDDRVYRMYKNAPLVRIFRSCLLALVPSNAAVDAINYNTGR